MNKYFLRLNWCITFLCGLLILGGCNRFSYDKELREIKIPPEKLREVEPLNLEEMKTDDQKQQPPKETPPKEIELTLEECRALALENNLELKVQLISPSVAAERVSEEEARFEAAFFSNMAYSEVEQPVLSRLIGSNVEKYDVDLGVNVPLRTGGTLQFDLAEGREKTDNEFSDPELNPAYSSRFSVSISQPLLRDGGKRANTYAIQIANYDRQITDARTKLEVIRVIAAVDRLYWRLYAARKELEVRKKEYDLVKVQLERARRFVDSGERSQIEITRSEAGVAQRLESIILAENNVRDRERELKHMLNKPGMEMQTATVLIPETKPDPVQYKLNRQQLATAATKNRMEMLELELQIAKDVTDIDYQHNQALPLVTLDYTYNINGLGATRDESYDLIFDREFEDHRLGLQLVVPLGNKAAKSRLNQVFYRHIQRLATRENRKAIIELEVLNAVDQLEANWQRILASRQSVILDERLFEAEKRQFQLGLGTSTDVLEAQTKFADAQSAKIRALAEYQIALVDLSYATGTLLGAAKVQWVPMVPKGN
jgi:outer membrane protein